MTTIPEGSTLLPCPFCGGEARLELRDMEPQGDSWYGKRMGLFPMCTGCGCCLFDGFFHEAFDNTDSEFGRNAAVTAWNRRAASPAAPEGATGCTRSHPHELMGQHCLLLTEIERLKSEIRWVSGVCSGAVELVDCMDDTEALRRIKERLDMAAPPAHTPAEGLAAIAQDLAARQTTLGPEINTALARAGSKLYDDGGAPHTPAAGALNGVAAAIEIRDVLRGYAGELTAATSQWLNRMCVAPPPTAQPPQQTTAAIAANAMRVVVSCAEDYLNAVAALGKVKEGKTLFDHSPIKDEEAYNAWTALNDTGKRLRECVERLRPAITEEPTR